MTLLAIRLWLDAVTPSPPIITPSPLWSMTFPATVVYWAFQYSWIPRSALS